MFVLFLTAIAASLAAAPPALDRGRAALDRNDVAAAVHLLEAAVAEAPSDAEAHYELGVACGRLAERSNVFRRIALAERARDEFVEAVRLDPDELDARSGLVQFYTLAPAMFGGSLEKALQEATEIGRRNAARGRWALTFITAHGER